MSLALVNAPNCVCVLGVLLFAYKVFVYHFLTQSQSMNLDFMILFYFSFLKYLRISWFPYLPPFSHIKLIFYLNNFLIINLYGITCKFRLRSRPKPIINKAFNCCPEHLFVTIKALY